MHESAKQIFERGEKWVDENPEVWQRLKSMVRHDAALWYGKDLRISYYVEQIRFEYNVHIPNAIQAYLSRRLEKEVRGARFTKSKSKLNLLMADEDD